MSAASQRALRIGPSIARAPLRGRNAPILEQELLGVRLVTEEEIDTSILEREFPGVDVSCADPADEPRAELVVDDFAWRGAFDFASFDEMIDDSRPIGVLVVRGDDSAGVACEMLTRYQRLVARRNAASSTTMFDDVLRAHAAEFDPSLPSAHEDLRHALDAWQWTLRLDPDAGLAAQLAALFHDIARLGADPQERVEHRAPDHRSGKANVADGSAWDRVLALLSRAGVSKADALRARDIVGGQENRAHDPEVLLLDEADALSFLSLESSRYLDHFGVAQTRRKIQYTLGRLGPRARERLAHIRLRPDVDRLRRT